jgi:serine/threonine protein kinase
VLHRDLKPGNIMLGKYGETLLVDWGLAKTVGRPESTSAGDERTLRPSSGSGLAATQMGSAIGTPAYMSPEQATGRLDLLGPASDVYSLGATLYALLTGQAAFPDGDIGQILEKVRNGDYPRPRQVQTLAKRKEKLGPDHPDTLNSMNNLALAYQKNGDFAKAELVLRELLVILQKKQPDTWTTFYTQSQLGDSLLGQKRSAEAEPLLLAGYEGMKQREARIPADAKKYPTEALERLVQLYEAWGQKDKAAQWRKELEARKGPAKKP